VVIEAGGGAAILIEYGFVAHLAISGLSGVAYLEGRAIWACGILSPAGGFVPLAAESPTATEAASMRLSLDRSPGEAVTFPLCAAIMDFNTMRGSTRCSTRSNFGYHVFSGTWQSPLA
jgi:hypothetical protein